MRVLSLLTIAQITLWFTLRETLQTPFDFSDFLLSFGSISILYLFSITWVTKQKVEIPYIFFALTGLIFRLILLTDHPILSTDVHRYIWDGALILKGFNPFAHAPVELPDLGLPLPPDHADLPTLYPPLSLLYFAMVSLFSLRPWVYSLAASLFDFLSSVTLAKALKLRSISASWSIIIAWHPLLVLESGHSGHVDSLGLFFISLAIFYSTRLIPTVSLITAAGLIKLWPISLLSLVCNTFRGRKWAVMAFFLFLCAVGIPVIGSHRFSGFSAYLERWEFHGSLFPLLRWLWGGVYARIVLWILFLAVVLRVSRSSHLRFEEKALGIIGAFLLLSPTVHPWYVLWLIPFLVFERKWEWFYLSMIMACAYAVIPRYLEQHVWAESAWPKWVTYLPVYGILIWKLAARRWRK